jgi:hypothetical protein
MLLTWVLIFTIATDVVYVENRNVPIESKSPASKYLANFLSLLGGIDPKNSHCFEFQFC